MPTETALLKDAYVLQLWAVPRAALSWPVRNAIGIAVLNMPRSRTHCRRTSLTYIRSEAATPRSSLKSGDNCMVAEHDLCSHPHTAAQSATLLSAPDWNAPDLRAGTWSRTARRNVSMVSPFLTANLRR